MKESQDKRRIPFRASIGSRIFGLALVLVCLMTVLVGFLLWQVTVLNRELQTIASFYEPLDNTLVDLNEAGLRRRLAFERWYGTLGASAPRGAVIAETSADYAKFNAQIGADIERAKALLAARSDRRYPQLVRIAAMLDEVAATYVVLTARQHEVLDLMQKGETARAADIEAVLDDLQVNLQNQRDEMQRLIESVMSAATEAASRRHTQVVWVAVAATATSVLLGLSLAALVTRRLVGPVRSLVSGMQTVEKGDLTVELPIHSPDEVGALTRSFNFFIRELRAKEEMRDTFGKYVDPRIRDRIMLDPGAAESSGGREQMSVAFTDLVGFTAIGEQLTPAGVVNLLNRHFTLQSEAIQQYQGVIDKFIGDAVMAFWGPPFTGEDEHAALACRAALEQMRAVERLQAMLPEITGLRKNLPRVDIRIGISAGEVIVGSIGSKNTRSYTVIGDTVNLASRLEHANRFYGTHILVCESTRAAAGDAIVTREIDTIVTKGKSETTRVFEVLGLREELSPVDLTLSERFAAALAAYRARDWNAAEAGFRDCLGLRPGDPPASLFLTRIADFRVAPPAADWNGVWVFAVK